MEHASWDDSLDYQTPPLKPWFDFCVVDLSLRVDPRWILCLRVSIMGRILLSLQMVLRNQRPVLTPWNKLLLVLFVRGKVLPYRDDVVNDPLPHITLSNESLSDTTEVETTKASSERVDRGIP